MFNWRKTIYHAPQKTPCATAATGSSNESAIQATIPGKGTTYKNRGDEYFKEGKFEEAEGCYRQAIAIHPDYAEACNMLGNALNGLGKTAEAAACYQKAIALKPDYAGALNNLGNMLYDQGNLDESIACFQKALVLMPDDAGMHSNMGNAFKAQGKLDAAVGCYREAVALQPDYTDAHSNLGVVLKDQGKLDEAVDSYRHALSLNPGDADVHSNLLITMQYSATLTPSEIFDEHLRFAEQFEAPLKPHWQMHANAPDPQKRLKLGYVSPDFRGHSVAYFIEPVLDNHDKSQVEVFCYYNHFAHDRFTDRIKSKADHWAPCMGLSDLQLAERIRADGIDILVDLAGHSAHNRLLTFARKPAPVQVAYIGYPATTGMSAIDYRITDGHTDPAGMTEPFNIEQLWRLPEIYCCYQAHEDSPEAINHPPMEDNGYVTFGCFNNFAKVTDRVITTWARLLEKVPSSRLMLKVKGIDSTDFRSEVENRFARLGIPGTSLILVGQQRENPFALYNRVDVALDPFPYNGCTTSLDSLWMGVPFITLAGNSSLSRVGVSILTNAGLPELIADTEGGYAGIAAALALDMQKLKTLRAGLRDRIKQSPLMDGPRLTRYLEQAYREMWKRWCVAGSAVKSGSST